MQRCRYGIVVHSTQPLHRITLTCGRGARVSIEESLFPRASTVHNNKSTAPNRTNRRGQQKEIYMTSLSVFNVTRVVGLVTALLFSCTLHADEGPMFSAGAATSNITPPLGESIIGGWQPFPAITGNSSQDEKSMSIFCSETVAPSTAQVRVQPLYWTETCCRWPASTFPDVTSRCVPFLSFSPLRIRKTKASPSCPSVKLRSLVSFEQLTIRAGPDC